MDDNLEKAIQTANYTHYRLGQKAGHYESFFQRANHPSQPLAFWIRYTIFNPAGHPEKAIGELWAIWFDGVRGSKVAIKKVFPIGQCAFSTSSFDVRIHDATLRPDALKGSATSGGHHISWHLTYGGSSPPLFMLPLGRYQSAFPKAKSLVGSPQALYRGTIAVDDKAYEIFDWLGSQNHNWGSQHTDHYAWGQVTGFDTHPESFLEVATARIKIGPIWTPFMTPIVLRHRGEEIRFNSLIQILRARGSFSYFVWTFFSENSHYRMEGTISAPRDAFVGLRYYNPPGGEKHCLNTKIASCEMKVTDKRHGRNSKPEILFTAHRASFEILTDDRDHGIAIQA